MKKEKSLSPVPPKKTEKPNTLDFVGAVAEIKVGKKVRRLEWADQEEYCLMKDSFLMIHRGGKFHQWIVSDGDISAIDWIVIK